MISTKLVKGAVTDMRYFARSKFSRNLEFSLQKIV